MRKICTLILEGTEKEIKQMLDIADSHLEREVGCIHFWIHMENLEPTASKSSYSIKPGLPSRKDKE